MESPGLEYRLVAAKREESREGSKLGLPGRLVGSVGGAGVGGGQAGASPKPAGPRPPGKAISLQFLRPLLGYMSARDVTRE